ncbi:SDR family oxidoreductase [bacterium]|nr:SDR family oxidoreductase [bacterium]
MTRRALVTGGNKGIGLAACRGLAKLGCQVFLGSRDEIRGREALEALRSEGLEVELLILDVQDEASIDSAYEAIKAKTGGLDILVNNAAVYIDEGERALDVDIAKIRETLESNFYGPLMLCRTFLPGMIERGHGRVVNLSSGMGQLSGMGAGSAAYRLSKTALNATTRILAAEVEHPDVKVNAMCPGWVRTDMGGASAHRSPEEGADTILWLATLPEDGPSGGLFRDREPIPW